MVEYISKNLKQTEKLANTISNKIQKGDILALFGEVGAGKTTFTSMLLKHLNSSDIVTSPTFSLINEYSSDKGVVAHFDMYRILDVDDLYSIGFYDYLNTNKILIIEWPENIFDEIPKNAITIKITKFNETTRKFLIDGVNL